MMYRSPGHGMEDESCSGIEVMVVIDGAKFFKFTDTDTVDGAALSSEDVSICRLDSSK